MISIYLDANILILAFERPHAEGQYIWPVLDAVEAGEFRAKTSQITLAEILPKPLMLGQSDLTERYAELFQSKSIFEALPVTIDVLMETARIRAQRISIRLPDAIHLATARLSTCAIFLTADQRLSTVGAPTIVSPNSNCLTDLRRLAR